MSHGEFVVRPTRESDARELNELYVKVGGRPRTVEQWRWEWLEGPRGPAPSWVVIESASGRIAGHHGLIEVPLRCDERRLRAARTENTMVDPALREAFYYPAVEAQLLKEYRERYDVLFTAAGKSVQAAMRRRLGYRPVGRWCALTIAETLAFRAARDLGRVAGAAASALGRVTLREPEGGAELVATDDFERVERLERDASVSPRVRLDHDAAYLRWRLAEHPWNRFRCALLVRGGRDEAFAAWREEPARGAAKVFIEHVFTRGGDEASYRDLFERLAWQRRSDPIRMQIRTLDGDRPLTRAARAIAPAWLRREPELDEAELLALAPGLPPGVTWDVTMAIDEGL
jgi:hypothetical protein